VKIIKAADLFCGAGGTSTGLEKACEDLGYKLDLLAINHWDIAIATHSANHSYARHICETLDSIDPRKVVPGGHLDLLVASPECTHHSNARGGKPCSDQSRASGWHVVRWAEALRIDNILIENVKEFQSWGPLGVNGMPLKSRKGETFRAFLNALTSLGYKVDFKVLNAAYYGDPTTRERLFIIARRGHRKINWPQPTHTPDGSSNLFGKTKPWRTARGIIDWSIPGQSIFTRKKPLSPNTMNRIFAGLRKFSGKELEPFLVMLYGTSDVSSINRPVPTVTTSGAHHALCQPFLVEYYGNSKVSSIKKPLPAVTTKDRFGVVQPFIMGVGGPKGSQNPRSIDRPLGTVVTEQHAALVQPFLVGITQTGGNGKRIRSIDRPVPTICTKEEFALCEPFVLGQQSCAAPRSVDKPIPTVAAAGAIALVQPKINGQILDIHFRMLKPQELARAMSFGDDYKFEGNREAQVKQIGNAVPVMLAKELCKSLLK
jgi:DNA (cytosine-5)-methyltransferase 1